jgi:hypothetical protein
LFVSLKAVKACLVVTKRGCIERKARAILKESSRKATWASHLAYWWKELYVTLVIMQKYGADCFQPISNSPRRKSFIKTNELPSSLWNIQCTPLVLQRSKSYAEFGTVYRYEQRIVMVWHVRGFTQDDAHILYSRTTGRRVQKKWLIWYSTYLVH